LEVLKWLILHNVDLDHHAATEAAFRDAFETLELLAQHGIYPIDQAAEYALLMGRLEMSQWLARHNIHATRASLQGRANIHAQNMNAGNEACYLPALQHLSKYIIIITARHCYLVNNNNYEYS
jgi:hypothetical protein